MITITLGVLRLGDEIHEQRGSTRYYDSECLAVLHAMAHFPDSAISQSWLWAEVKIYDHGYTGQSFLISDHY